jgi:putative membrane protein
MTYEDLYPHIKRNPGFWSLLIKSAKANTMRSILVSEIFIAVYVFLIIFLDAQHYLNWLHINMDVHSLLGITLGLLLVIRTNTAYDRWWEGRRLIANTVGLIRSLSLKISIALYHADESIRKRFENLLVAFFYAMKEHLRDGVKWEEISHLSLAQINSLRMAKHVPNRILSLINEDLLILGTAKKFVWDDLGNHHRALDALNENLAGCERIKITPLPFAYRMHLKFFILVFILTLPFGLMQNLHYFTIPAVMLIFYALVGLELIGDEIEDPFGTDENDIPMDQIADVVAREIREFFQIAAKNPTPGAGSFPT